MVCMRDGIRWYCSDDGVGRKIEKGGRGPDDTASTVGASTGLSRVGGWRSWDRDGGIVIYTYTCTERFHFGLELGRVPVRFSRNKSHEYMMSGAISVLPIF